MSLYDEKEYRSFYEKKIQQIPINEVKQNFKEEFVETYKNFKVDEIKGMMYLNPKEEIKFDFIFNNKETVNDDFFENNRIISEKAGDEEKIEILINFIENSYEILTPKILKQVFEEFLGISNSDLTDDDYEMMIYQIFNKYQINLKDDHDKLLFKNFLKESIKEEIQEIEKLLPSVNKTSNDKVRTSAKNNLKDKEKERDSNKIMI
jgi:hypothetical protein